MLRKAPLNLLLMLSASVAMGQSLTFQDGVNSYDATVDTEFRAANPTDPQGEKEFLSIDEFDGGFQTQGAIRFENLFGGATGIPNGVDILFAELQVFVTSSTDAAAVIGFHRVLGPDLSRTEGSGAWGNDDTWFSLGGDLIPDGAGLLDGDPIFAGELPSPPNAPGLIESTLLPEATLPTASNTLNNRLLTINVTSSLETWAAAGSVSASNAANLGWAINNNTGNGWDFLSAEYGTADPVAAQAFAAARSFPSFLDLRPKLTVVFAGAAGQGDINLDGSVNLDDYQILLNNMAIELNGAIDPGDPGDLDFDRDVDLADFKIFKNVFPGGAAGFARAVAVPEPAGVLLALVALGGVLAVRRR